jgi:predicted ArsR family transcriptional regulator
MTIHDKKIMSSGNRYQGNHTWRFLSNHTQVLLCIARDLEIRVRDISQMVGITERAAQRIVADLIDAGYVDREKVGRRNRYHLNVETRYAARGSGRPRDRRAPPSPGAARDGRARSHGRRLISR